MEVLYLTAIIVDDYDVSTLIRGIVTDIANNASGSSKNSSISTSILAPANINRRRASGVMIETVPVLPIPCGPRELVLSAIGA